jgi:hypothetical protein
MEYGWDAVAEATKDARAIAWDGCHKIYLAMDDEQVAIFQSYGYGRDDDGSRMFTTAELDSGEMFAILKRWYEVSCGLKFIQSVETTENPNDGFVNLIPQCWDEEEL